MTKCIVLTEGLGKRDEAIKPKCIEFIKCLRTGIDVHGLEAVVNGPVDWDYIELIRNSGKGRYDIMFAYDEEEREIGALYLGYWNDGVVE